MDMLEIYSDVWCPFAYVGIHAALVERHRFDLDDRPILFRAWPLELVNGRPLDPEVTASHVRDLRVQVAPHLFRGFDPSRFPSTTLPALALIHVANDRDVATGEAVSLAVRRALFEDGVDVSRPEELERVAHEFGLSARELDDGPVRRDWTSGQARGVLGSPHFFHEGGDAFCPALDITRDADGHLDLRPNAERLHDFLTAFYQPRPLTTPGPE